MDDIEVELHLFEEEVLEVFWEGVVDVREDGEEVFLKGGYDALCRGVSVSGGVSVIW